MLNSTSGSTQPQLSFSLSSTSSIKSTQYGCDIKATQSCLLWQLHYRYLPLKLCEIHKLKTVCVTQQRENGNSTFLFHSLVLLSARKLQTTSSKWAWFRNWKHICSHYLIRSEALLGQTSIAPSSTCCINIPDLSSLADFIRMSWTPSFVVFDR